MPNKVYRFVLCVSILCSILTGCAGVGINQEAALKRSISTELAIDCGSADISDSWDSHGGFHGDGTSFYRLDFPDDSIVNDIKESTDWSQLPLTDNLTALVYGKEIDNCDYAPSITKTNDGEHPLFPPIENGYYCFIDRHSESTDKKDDTDVLNRYSKNFTIAIYDTDNNVLYYGSCDT